jgi:hypothetical protein
MSDADALKIAIDLFYLPSQVRATRTRPLPKGTKFLLLIAAGDADAMRTAQDLSSRPSAAIHEAATFFIEQILLEHSADEYRKLGLDRTAPIAELRAHMALLMKWLHPDINSDERRSAMARQVIRAWKQINSPGSATRRSPSIGIETAASQNRIAYFATPRRGMPYRVPPDGWRMRKPRWIRKLVIALARKSAVP